MKRKALLLALVLVVAGQAFAYKAAIGGEFGLNVAGGLPNSALLSFRLPKFPPVIGLGVSIPENGSASAALLLDWWLYQGNLVSFINYYVGPGLYLQVGDSVSAGLRVPVGLNAFPIPPPRAFRRVRSRRRLPRALGRFDTRLGTAGRIRFPLLVLSRKSPKLQRSGAPPSGRAASLHIRMTTSQRDDARVGGGGKTFDAPRRPL